MGTHFFRMSSNYFHFQEIVPDQACPCEELQVLQLVVPVRIRLSPALNLRSPRPEPSGLRGLPLPRERRQLLPFRDVHPDVTDIGIVLPGECRANPIRIKIVPPLFSNRIRAPPSHIFEIESSAIRTGATA